MSIVGFRAIFRVSVSVSGSAYLYSDKNRTIWKTVAIPVVRYRMQLYSQLIASGKEGSVSHFGWIQTTHVQDLARSRDKNKM